MKQAEKIDVIFYAIVGFLAGGALIAAPILIILLYKIVRALFF